MKAIINISLKQGVLDPIAKTTEQALQALGFDSVKGVKMKKQIVLELDAADKDAARILCEKMCEELLANPVIEEYEIVL
ncbi:phosphoribosylformylglycinamidine synthase subunit PurS [Campylobacter sp. 19-13652]|uniref:phosphoribosylformylglycinamidine synthase subunit PurS n=1 Tax=Campylobacter sp. 19-13652 TaxID=2840180 RepID=UPI001C761059|nr:phosphoribosylformylglycinamidine synthase subunit PurS [Campylobacter sp. 19-13652]BCX79563.1 phosphoribosylformylglycinamidine synthase subunit PurS [Campylobacter sp. 19-13652]